MRVQGLPRATVLKVLSNDEVFDNPGTVLL